MLHTCPSQRNQAYQLPPPLTHGTKWTLLFSREQRQPALQPFSSCLCHLHYSTPCLQQKLYPTMTERFCVKEQAKLDICLAHMMFYFFLKTEITNIFPHSAQVANLLVNNTAIQFWKGFMCSLRLFKTIEKKYCSEYPGTVHCS